MKLKTNIAFTLLFIVASAFLHFKDYNKLPASTHAWAQSDHYALALGFYNDGFDFFHPTTFALDVQFPSKNALENPQGITSVDFPILHYSVAILMKIFGTTAPWVFRMIMLLISFLALFCLFKTIKEIKSITVASIFVSFIMFQPIYAYYQDGFHVSAAAFNVFLIGLSFILRYFHKKESRHFTLAIVFLTLAALMRFTQIISLLALGGAFFIISIKEKKIHKQLYYIATGVIVVLAYFIYNKGLASEYGSVFLGQAMPPKSFSLLVLYLKKIIISYSMEFLPILHFSLLIVGIMTYRKYGTSLIKGDSFFLWLAFSLLGTSLFSILMMWGISAHNYYSLDTWQPFLCIGIAFLIWHIDFNKISKEVMLITSLLFGIGSFAIATEHQLKNYREDASMNNAEGVINDFMSSASWLNQHIEAEAKTVVICDEGWNTPMVAWQRKVHRIHNINENTLQRLSSEEFDYIVVHNASVSPEHLKTIQRYCHQIKNNKQISIYKQR